MFAYPPPTQPPKKETVTKVATAVLSTTAKAKAREKKKAAAEGDAMDTVGFLVYMLWLRLTKDDRMRRRRRTETSR